LPRDRSRDPWKWPVIERQWRRWTLSSALARAAEVWKNEGLTALWFKVLGETIYRRLVVIERPLNGRIPVFGPPAVPMETSLLGPSDIHDYVQFSGKDPAEIRRRLDSGEWCFVVRQEGRMIHACWAVAGTARIDYLRAEMPLPPGVVYLYEGLTLPEWRSKGASHARSAVTTPLLRDAGFTATRLAVVPENRTALRSFLKMGYRRIGVVGWLRLGRWRRDFARAERPRASPWMRGSGALDPPSGPGRQVALDRRRGLGILQP
jgi:hypothetical protein